MATVSEGEMMTLEAFADTIIPGEKRFPGDRAVAGAADGAGAAAAGAIELCRETATGIHSDLDELARMLNEHAAAHARLYGLRPEPPEFVGLGFEDRTALVRSLLAPAHPEKEVWVLLALFCNMAFDTAAHLHTPDAFAAGHPGLVTMGLTPPDADGLWRFPGYSYRRKLADIHPGTIESGSLA